MSRAANVLSVAMGIPSRSKNCLTGLPGHKIRTGASESISSRSFSSSSQAHALPATSLGRSSRPTNVSTLSTTSRIQHSEPTWEAFFTHSCSMDPRISRPFASPSHTSQIRHRHSAPQRSFSVQAFTDKSAATSMVSEGIRNCSQKEALSQQSMLGSQPCIVLDSIHRGKRTSARAYLHPDIAFSGSAQRVAAQESITIPISVPGTSGSQARISARSISSCSVWNCRNTSNNHIVSRRYLHSTRSRRSFAPQEGRPTNGLSYEERRAMMTELREKMILRSSVPVLWGVYTKIVQSQLLPQVQSDDIIVLYQVLAQSHQSEEAMEMMLQVALDVNEIGKQLPQEPFEILMRQATDHMPADQIKAATWQIQGRRRFFSELVQLCDTNAEMRRVLGLYSQLVKSSFDVDGYSTYFQGRTSRAKKLAVDVLKWVEGEGTARNRQIVEYLLVFLLDRSRLHQVFGALGTLSKDGLVFSHGFYTTAIHRFGRDQKFDYMNYTLDLMRRQGLKPLEDTYSAIIDAHSKAGNLREAQQAYQEVLAAGLVPTNKTLGPMLEAVGAMGEYDMTRQLVGQMNSSGVSSNEYTFSALLQSVSLDSAKSVQLFNELSKQMVPNTVNYNILIRAFQRQSDLDGAFRVFRSMVADGVRPDKFTFSSILSLFAIRGDTNGAEAFWNEMVGVHGVKPNAFAYGSMMHVYCTAEDMLSAQTVYREMIQSSIMPNEVIFGTLLNAYARHGDLTQMLSIYDAMRSEDLKPNSYIYSNLLFGLVKDGDMPAAQRLYDTMVEDGFGHNVLAQTILMKGYLDHGGFQESQAIYKNMIRSGLIPNFMTYAALLQAHTKRGEIREGRDFLNKILKSRGLVVVGDEEDESMESEELKQLGINKSHDRASASSPDSFDRDFVSDQVQEGHLSTIGTERKPLKVSARPNPLMTFTPLLDAYAKEGNFVATKAMFDEIKARGLEPNTVTFTILMDSYRRAGDAENVLSIWNELFDRFLSKWRSVQSHSDHTAPAKAVNFEWIGDRLSTKASKLQGILQRPVSIVLDSLSYSGRIQEAKAIWKQLEEAGFQFDSSNWNDYCIALARNGLLLDSLEIVQDKLLPGYIAAESRQSGADSSSTKTLDAISLDSRSGGGSSRAMEVSGSSVSKRGAPLESIPAADESTIPKLGATLLYPRPRTFAALADSLEDLLSLEGVHTKQLSGSPSDRQDTTNSSAVESESRATDTTSDSQHNNVRRKLVEDKLQPYPHPFENLEGHHRQILWDIIQKDYSRVLEALAGGMLVVTGPQAIMRSTFATSAGSGFSKDVLADPTDSTKREAKFAGFRPWRRLKFVMKDMERQKFIQEREEYYELLRKRKPT
ncbi:hypothetical protein KI688_003835 [Linnemannia hyalina]|uniref:PROP1-like PPR domain-containing protein n=1 Tax=Linnemannia hyalina TaxID=64524 RepID=A0A9P7XMY5_9FUNG|nr:hypothetical protein KI688_003835 [Linnemannia hyalina]